MRADFARRGCRGFGIGKRAGVVIVRRVQRFANHQQQIVGRQVCHDLVEIQLAVIVRGVLENIGERQTQIQRFQPVCRHRCKRGFERVVIRIEKTEHRFQCRLVFQHTGHQIQHMIEHVGNIGGNEVVLSVLQAVPMLLVLRFADGAAVLLQRTEGRQLFQIDQVRIEIFQRIAVLILQMVKEPFQHG